MLTDAQLEWIKKNKRDAFYIVLFFVCGFLYSDARKDRKEYNEFYKSVYEKEFNRNEKWEKILKLTQRDTL